MTFWTLRGVLLAGGLGTLVGWLVLVLLRVSTKVRSLVIGGSVVFLLIGVPLFLSVGSSEVWGWLAHQATFALAVLLVLVWFLPKRMSM